MDILYATAAEEAVFLPPLRAVGPGADDRGGAEALELPVRVRVGADAPVEVEAASGQACLLFVVIFLLLENLFLLVGLFGWLSFFVFRLLLLLFLFGGYRRRRRREKNRNKSGNIMPGREGRE